MQHHQACADSSESTGPQVAPTNFARPSRRSQERTLGVAQRVNDLHRLHLEWGTAVLAEHGGHRVEHDVGLGQVGSRALDEHVPRVQRDLQAAGND